MNLHLVKNGQQTGPYDENDLRARVATGEFNGDSLAWQPGMAGWTPSAPGAACAVRPGPARATAGRSARRFPRPWYQHRPPPLLLASTRPPRTSRPPGYWPPPQSVPARRQRQPWQWRHRRPGSGILVGALVLAGLAGASDFSVGKVLRSRVRARTLVRRSGSSLFPHSRHHDPGRARDRPEHPALA